MRRVSISELKAKLSHYLDLVRAGEEVIVTDRGRPIARLAGLADDAALDQRMRQLIRLGRIRAPVEVGALEGRGTLPEDPEGLAVAALLDERATGR